MRKFESNRDDFTGRARRRVLVELCVLVILSGYFWSDWSWWWPGWLKQSVLVVLAGYFLLGLYLYPHARSIARSGSVLLMEGALGVTSQEGVITISYGDLLVSNVTKKDGEIVVIKLKTVFGQYIKLEGLENMEELYEVIVAYVSGQNLESLGD